MYQILKRTGNIEANVAPRIDPYLCAKSWIWVTMYIWTRSRDSRESPILDFICPICLDDPQHVVRGKGGVDGAQVPIMVHRPR